MARTLMAEVLFTVEADMDGASGALVSEGRRIQKLQKDLAGLRGQTQDAVGGTRETTIHGLFFGGLFGRMFNELQRSSGALATFISLAGGLTGTFLDIVLLEIIEKGSSVAEALKNIAKTMETDSIVITPFGPLPDIYKEDSPDVILTATPATGLTEGAAKIAGIVFDGIELPDLDLLGLIDRADAIGRAIGGSEELDRAVKAAAEAKKLQDILRKDAEKNMANFWFKIIVLSDGFKKITGTDGGK